MPSKKKKAEKTIKEAPKNVLLIISVPLLSKRDGIFVVLRRRQRAYIRIDFLLIFSWKSLSTKCRSLHSMNYASISPRAVRAGDVSFGSISDFPTVIPLIFFGKRIISLIEFFLNRLRRGFCAQKFYNWLWCSKTVCCELFSALWRHNSSSCRKKMHFCRFSDLVIQTPTFAWNKSPRFLLWQSLAQFLPFKQKINKRYCREGRYHRKVYIGDIDTTTSWCEKSTLALRWKVG